MTKGRKLNLHSRLKMTKEKKIEGSKSKMWGQKEFVRVEEGGKKDMLKRVGGIFF